MRRAASPAIMLAIVALILCPEAKGAERYSGRVVAVSDDGGRVTVEAVGPWHGPGTGVHTIDVDVHSGTRIRRVYRREGFAAGGWPGAFGGESVSPRAIDVGDFITVTVVQATGRARALAIDVLDGGARSKTCAPDELLVGFRRAPAPEATAELYRRLQAKLIETLHGLPVHRIRIAAERRAEAARALALYPDVRFVERNCARTSAMAAGGHRTKPAGS